MTEVIAKLRYYRATPRKVRLMADLVRGKKITDAINQLAFSEKKPSDGIVKLLKSALSNAKHNYKIDTDKNDLYIKEIRVDEGPALKRYRPVWRGSAHPFKRRSSHITVVLKERQKAKKGSAKPKKFQVRKNNYEQDSSSIFIQNRNNPRLEVALV